MRAKQQERRPLRVLHLIETLGRGGAERNLVNVLHSLPAAEHAVCYLRAPGDYAAVLRERGIPVRCLQFKGAIDIPRVIIALCEELRRGDFHLVLTQIWLSDLLGRLAGAIAGVPVLSAVQTSAYEPETLATYSRRGRLKTRMLQAADAITAKLLVRRVIAVSQFVGQQTATRLRLPKDRIVVISNSVELDQFYPPTPQEREQARAALDLRPDDIVLVTVGKLNKGKGNDILCAAMPLVLSAYPNAKLLILGKGSDAARLTRQALQDGAGHAVRLLGEQSDIRKYLIASDLFVFASRYEGLPLVVLEAMACGLPCLLSNIPPHRELADDGRVAVLIPLQPAAWAREIIDAIKHGTDSRLMAEAGRSRCTRLYTAQAVAASLDALFQQEAAPSRWERASRTRTTAFIASATAQPTWKVTHDQGAISIP